MTPSEPNGYRALVESIDKRLLSLDNAFREEFGKVYTKIDHVDGRVSKLNESVTVLKTKYVMLGAFVALVLNVALKVWKP